MVSLLTSFSSAWFRRILGTVSFGMPMIHTKDAGSVLCYYGELHLRSSHLIDRTEVQPSGDQSFTGGS